MSLLHSAFITLRDRGPATLAKAACNLAYGGLQRDLLGRRFVEKRVYDYRMWLDLRDSGISRTLLLFGARELDHKIMLERVLKPGMTVFDIGANIGYYVLMELGLLGERGRVVAVEPSPANVALLRRNIDLNGRGGQVEIIEGAVSDAEGRRSFHLAEQSNLNTFHSNGSGSQYLSGETIEVSTLPLRRLVERHGKPDLLRMDVEGHEVEILGGLCELVDSGQAAPAVIFETHLTRYTPDHDMAPVLRGLFERGYRAALVSSSQEQGTRRIEALGYRGEGAIATDGVTRALFADLGADHLIDLICRTGGVRTVLLAR